MMRPEAVVRPGGWALVTEGGVVAGVSPTAGTFPASAGVLAVAEDEEEEVELELVVELC